jgi:hypothetical protein
MEIGIRIRLSKRKEKAMRNIFKKMRHILDERIASKMRCKLLILFVVAALAAFLCSPAVGSASILKTGDSFAVLGAATVTNTVTGATTLTGNLGVYPGSAITGLGTITINGVNGLSSPDVHFTDGVAQQAWSDFSNAYDKLAAMTFLAANDFTGAPTLGGRTLTSGVYHFGDAADLTGTLTLDAQGNNNAFWVFQIGKALTTASSSIVQVIHLGSNGGIDDGVFWQVGSSATLGSSTTFEGNILADQSITLNTSAKDENGRLYARVGQVALDNNTISNICPNGGPGFNGGLGYDTNGNIVAIGPSPGPSPAPEPATMLLLGLGLIGLAGVRRKIH